MKETNEEANALTRQKQELKEEIDSLRKQQSVHQESNSQLGIAKMQIRSQKNELIQIKNELGLTDSLSESELNQKEVELEEEMS